MHLFVAVMDMVAARDPHAAHTPGTGPGPGLGRLQGLPFLPKLLALPCPSLSDCCQPPPSPPASVLGGCVHAGCVLPPAFPIG